MQGSATRTADVLAARLHAAGIRHAFGMPGGEVLTFVDALGRAGIDFVLVRHENAGGFMAEGVHHATGAPGLLVATVGPGALNAVNVVENAREDRVPLIVVTGCVDPGARRSATRIRLRTSARSSRPWRRPASRWCRTRPRSSPTRRWPPPRRASPGPSTSTCPSRSRTPPPARARTCAAARRCRSPRAGPVARRPSPHLSPAERPLIVAGVDALNDGAARQLRAAAETLGAPVITTYKAKGMLPEDHPLALGGAGLSPVADAILLPVVRAADAILLAGYDPSRCASGWQDARSTRTARPSSTSRPPPTRITCTRAASTSSAPSGRP
jgi:acetolactate synthase I/II/III large subunit